MTDYDENLKKLAEAYQKMLKAAIPQVVDVNQALELFSQKIREITLPVIKNLNSTEYMSPLFAQFKEFAKQLQEAKKNPDSVFNYYRYADTLNKFHWT